MNFCDRNCAYDSWMDASVDDGFDNTAPVGSYPEGASFYGALDMAGNAVEWVADWYSEDYYADSPDRNPQGPSFGSLYRVVRGGSWRDWYAETSALCTARSKSVPSAYDQGVSFRLVVDSGTSGP